MKKILCLVLALVFVLGLCTVGAGAALSDIDSVEYKDAVNSMNKLGIINGFEDGSFKPGAPVTREQAAKMITIMMLGTEMAGVLPASKVFSDVEASRWSAPFVYFCSQKGIINGLGDGTFNPEGNVKMKELCKMLLAAVGYGRKGEYTGEGWDVNVFTDAVSTKLFKGLKSIDFEGEATREAAAQVIFTTMNKVQEVEYSDLLGYNKTGSTYADSTWELQTFTGIVIENTATGLKTGSKIKSSTGTLDIDADTTLEQVGHEVTVKYMNEDGKNLAYYVDDNCVEYTGKKVPSTSTDAAFQLSFTNYDEDGVPTVPAKANWATSAGSFVVNEDGKIVGYKVNSYKVATLSIDAKGKATIGGNEVKIAEGMKNGQVVTVKQTGDIYTAYANTTSENVQIFKNDGAAGTFNNGDIKPTKLAAADYVVPAGYTDIATKPSVSASTYYTFLIDAEGFAFAYKVYTPNVESNYVYLVKGYSKSTSAGYDDQGNPVAAATTNYAQCVDAAGQIINPAVSADYSALAAGVYKITDAAGGKKTLTALSATDDPVKKEAYAPSPKLVENSDTVYVCIDNTGAKLKVALDAKPAKGKTITYSYVENKAGSGSTVNTRILKTIWFLKADAEAGPSTNVPNSYIYVKSTTKDHEELFGGKVHDYYNVYIDGDAKAIHYEQGKTDAAFAADAFFAYSFDAAKEIYALTAATGTSVTLDDSNYIDGGKLYTPSATFDLAGVKIADLATAAGQTKITDIDGLIAAVVGGKTVTIKFVATGTGATKKIGGLALYITAIA